MDCPLCPFYTLLGYLLSPVFFLAYLIILGVIIWAWNKISWKITEKSREERMRINTSILLEDYWKKKGRR